MSVEKLNIDGTDVEISSEGVRQSTRYQIVIAGHIYRIFAEAIKDTEGTYNYSYGEVVYLTESPDLSKLDIFDETVEIIKKAIVQKAENKGLFFKFVGHKKI